MRRWCVVTIAMIAGGALIGCSSTATTTAGPANTAAPASASAGSTPGTAPGTTVDAGGTTGTSTTSTDEFCKHIKKANDASTSSSSAKVPSQADIDAFIGSLEKARDSGPPELKEPLAKLIETYKKLVAIMNDPAKQSEASAIFFDEQVTAADQKVREVVKHACGVDLNSGSSSSSGPSPSSRPTSGTSSASAASALCRDITSVSETDGKPTSLYSVKKAVCTANADASWGKAVFASASWSLTTVTDTPRWEVSVYTDSTPPATIEPVDALKLCDAISTYLASVGQPDAEISIGTSTSTDSINGPSKVLATKPSKGACALN